MTITVSVLGAGGNMGRRISGSLLNSPDYRVHHIEPSDRGRELLAAMGITATDRDRALRESEIVIFAVPDRIMQSVSEEIVPLLNPGTSILFLDPAAVAAGRIPPRADINCYVTHPTHPPLYSLLAEPNPDSRRDFWGGGLAEQAIVFATAWGDDDVEAERVNELVVAMFAPVSRSHRITVDQMAMLEPALTETLTNGCIAIIHEGMQLVIAAGVPEEATRDFLMGHLQIGIAIIFGELNWKLSEGAAVALQEAKGALFRDDWDTIFSSDAIMRSLKAMTGGL